MKFPKRKKKKIDENWTLHSYVRQKSDIPRIVNLTIFSYYNFLV